MNVFPFLTGKKTSCFVFLFNRKWNVFSLSELCAPFVIAKKTGQLCYNFP
jgi:hypothetical protein